MHDFGKLVYLDVQKTGSTFISKFLRDCCTLEERAFAKHARIRDGFDPGAVYFISVRNPVDQYLSLYRYGLDRKGRLFHALRKQGLTAFYDGSQDGFEAFVAFLLDDRNAASLGEGFHVTGPRLGIGFMTHRHLMLSFRHPLKALKKIPPATLPEVYRDRRIWRHAVRQESLVEDLQALAAAHPAFFDANAVARFARANRRINASKAGQALSTRIADALGARLEQKEWLLLREFYGHPAASGTARP